jgi:hypothetical protein
MDVLVTCTFLETFRDFLAFRKMLRELKQLHFLTILVNLQLRSGNRSADQEMDEQYLI